MDMASERGTRPARRTRLTATGAPATSSASDAPRQRVAHLAGQLASGATPQRTTLDGALIERGVRWWRSRSPHTRRALVGASLALLATLGVWGVVSVGLPPFATAHGAAAHSVKTGAASAPTGHAPPVALVGRLCVWLFGAGAYSTLALPLAVGALWVAEGLARRKLLRRWLAAPTVALWLLIELGARLIGGQAAGGALGDLLGDALATRLAHTPPSLVELIVLAPGMMCTLVIGVGLANDVGSALSALSGASFMALRRARNTRTVQAAVPQHGAEQARRTVARETTAMTAQVRVDDVAPLAEELAGRARQALFAERAVTQVYPLHITSKTIRLCVRPVERFKRDATGRIVRDAQGAPVIVRTRVSRILALRDELAQALGAPDLRLAPLSSEEAPDVDQPALVIEIPRR